MHFWLKIPTVYCFEFLIWVVTNNISSFWITKRKLDVCFIGSTSNQGSLWVSTISNSSWTHKKNARTFTTTCDSSEHSNCRGAGRGKAETCWEGQGENEHKLGKSLEGFIIINFDSALVSLIPLFVVGPPSLISQGLASFIAFEKCLDYHYGTKVFLCTLQLKIWINHLCFIQLLLPQTIPCPINKQTQTYLTLGVILKMLHSWVLQFIFL